jgi:hypothetical protein
MGLSVRDGKKERGRKRHWHKKLEEEDQGRP